MKDLSNFDFDTLPDQQVSEPSEAVMDSAFNTNPEEHTKIQEISKVSGVPSFAVKGNEQKLKTLNKLRNLDFSNSPVSSSFFKNFDNAVAGQNDIEKLKALESKLSDEKPGAVRFKDAFIRGGSRFKESFLRKTYRAETRRLNDLLLDDDALIKSLEALKASPSEIGGAGVLGPLLKEVPSNERADFIKSITVDDYKSALIERLNEFQQLKYNSIARSKQVEKDHGVSGDYTIDRLFEDPTVKNTLGFVLETGVESIPEMLTAMTGVGLLPVGIATSGRVAEERAENDGREEVSEEDDAIGNLTALPVVALEKLGIDKALLKTGGISKLSDVPSETLKRIFIEGSTESLQEVIEQLGGSVGTVEGVSSDDLKKSIVGGFLGGAGVSTAINTVKVPIELINSAQVKTSEVLKLDDQVQQEQSKINDIVEIVEEMELKQLSPDALRQFVLDSDGDKNTTIFIKSEKVKEYISTLKESDIDSDPALITIVAKLRESAALESDLDIPIDEFINDFIGSEHLESLSKHMTLKSETPSPDQIEQKKKQSQTYVDNLIAEASTEVESSIQADKIYEEVKEQLIDSGRLSERDAKISAQLVPAWATAFAKDNDISVEEAFKRSGLNVKGPLTGKTEELKAQGVLTQNTNGYYDDKNSTITLTENSNASTFIHEFGHFIYDMERRTTGKQLEKINQWFSKNAQAIAKESGVSVKKVSKYLSDNTTGDASTDKKIYIATHEQFARGFETYLMEGKSPSLELREVFRTIARWMSEIYRVIQGDLNVKLNDDMRGVFDRLLATEDQIAAAQARVEFEPLFTEAAMAGKTEEEFKKYKEAKEKVKNKATETLRDKLIKQLTREQQSWWNTQKKDYISEESKKLENERVHKARNVLTSGKIQISTDDVRDILEKPKGALPAKLNKMRSPDGMSADQAAVVLGYESGAEMINDLIDQPTIKEASEEAAQQRMLDEHGDLMNDGTIERAADEALQNEERGKLLLDELKTLSSLAKKEPPINRKQIKNLAEENIGKLSYRAIHPSKYRSAEIKAAKLAAELTAKGNHEEAMVAKTRQVMNYYLGMEATKAKSSIEKIVEHKSRYRKKSIRQEIQKGDAGHLDQIDNVLSRFEFRKSVPLKDVVSLSEFIYERNVGFGETIQSSKYTVDQSNITHWKNVTFDDLKGVDDTVKSLEHVARQASKIKMSEELVDFNKTVDSFKDRLSKLKTKFKPESFSAELEAETKNFLQRSLFKVEQVRKRYLSELSQMPWITRWLDDGEAVGLAHELLIQPVVDGYEVTHKLHEEVSKPIASVIKSLPKKTLERYNKIYNIPEIKNEVNTGNLHGMNIISIMLNMGNESNLRKLLLGEGWADKTNPESISHDNKNLKAIFKAFKPTKQDWEVVQSIWDNLETLYPHMAKTYSAESGLPAPVKIEPVPVVTEFGTFKGGFFPIKYDGNRSFEQSKNDDRDAARLESAFSMAGSISTSVTAGTTFERTQAYKPINLNLTVLDKHVKETIHYIGLAPAVRQINRVLSDKGVSTLLKEKLGEQEFSQIKPWLLRIAKDGHNIPSSFENKHLFNDFFGVMRRGMTFTYMGFRASSGLMQISGLANTAKEIGAGNTLRGVNDVFFNNGGNVLQSSISSFNNAIDMGSKVLSSRMATFDREIAETLQLLKGKTGVKAKLQELSMKHIAIMQMYAIDLPTWYGAYNKELVESGDRNKAVRYADWAVENIQGSSRAFNMSAFQATKNELLRSYYAFATFAASQLNQQRNFVRQLEKGDIGTLDAAAAMLFLYMVPAVYEAWVKGALDDEDAGEKLAWRTVDTALMGLPGVRDLPSVLKGFELSTPAISLANKGVTGFTGIASGEPTFKEVKNATLFLATMANLPGGSQAFVTGESLYKWAEQGETTFYETLITGPEK